MRKTAFILTLALLVFSVSPARADLSAKAAFLLLEKVPPGEYYPDARQFLGLPSAERVVDIEKDIKITRWGKSADSWTFEALHDAEQVRATRITWRTTTKSEQQRIFSQLTTAGKNFFGSVAIFKNMEEAQWEDFEGRWITRARIESGVSGGVTLLSGIRDVTMGSDRYGF
ncbi:MAG: hypothetical protein LBG12_08405 [Synergistaceae bacterium]|jgi:hypothetical protein|nr:hypothetical protein [Synergistaceae bacterium]